MLTKICGQDESLNMENIYGWPLCKNGRKTLVLKGDLSALTVSTGSIELKFKVLMKKSCHSRVREDVAQAELNPIPLLFTAV